MSTELRRTLELRDLVPIVIGTVIGSGIFIVPAAVLQQTGGAIGVALLVWLVGGVISLLGALTYGELGASSPDAGGLYVFIRDAFGSLPAFLFGWAAFLVIGSGSVATLAAAFSRYLGQLVPLEGMTARLASVAMIAAVAAINVRGTRHGARVQNWSTAIKVGAVLVMSATLLSLGGGLGESAGRWLPEGVSGSLLSGAGTAMIGVLWAYEGWHYVTFSAGETRDPQRSFPRGIIAGTAAVIGVYLLANLAYVAALGADRAAHSERIAAEAVATLLGPAAGNVVAAVILVSIFGAANGLTLTAPRLYFAMARDGVFFRKLAEVHPRTGTPAFAIVTSSAWAMALAVSGTFEQLLAYVVFAGWIFYGLAASSIFTHRRRRPEASRPFRVPGYPVTPLLFVVAAAAIVVNTLFSVPVQALAGLGIVALGTPAYLVWRARLRPRPEVASVSGSGSARAEPS